MTGSGSERKINEELERAELGWHLHFNRSNLEKGFGENHIEYRWIGEPFGGYSSNRLGGGSPNGVWNSEGFQNYAPHAPSEKFQRALDEIIDIDEEKRVIMCGENTKKYIL